MKFDILTLFPAMFSGPMGESIIGRAADRGLIDISYRNIRDFAFDKHRTVDDTPYGGGAGMLMKPEPLAACIEQAKAGMPAAKVLLTTPGGVPFTQNMAAELATEPGLIIICGRYEGIDERISELYVDQKVSIGDFVLTGGELAAMVIVDAVARLVTGVLGSGASTDEESFSDGLLEYPQYTRPPEFRGLSVPEVLLSGNHKDIALWRRRQALLRTMAVRPEMLDRVALTPSEREFLLNHAERDDG